MIKKCFFSTLFQTSVILFGNINGNNNAIWINLLSTSLTSTLKNQLVIQIILWFFIAVEPTNLKLANKKLPHLS